MFEKFRNNFLKIMVKDGTAGLTITEFVGLKSKMYLFVVNEFSEHKKAKDVNKNVATKTSHNAYKDGVRQNV